MQIENDSDARETTQLLIMATRYFSLGKKEKEKITDEQILTKKASELSKEEHMRIDIMFTNAHLSSCAVRLCTIDEKLEDFCRKSKNNHRDLRCSKYKATKCEVENKIPFKKEDIVNKKILHFLLRHNIAHVEADKSPRWQRYKDFEEILITFSINEKYDAIGNIINDIKSDLYKNNLFLKQYSYLLNSNE